MKTDQLQISNKVTELVTDELTVRFQIKITPGQIVVALKAPWLLHGVLANFDMNGKLTDAGEVFGTRLEHNTTPLKTVKAIISKLEEFIR